MYPEVETSVFDILNEPWNITNGTVVPETSDIVMKNGGRVVDATYLYADLAGSSRLAHIKQNEVAAKIIRAYINTAVRILRHKGGEIRSFDGDRVMAIFIGKGKNNDAVRAALAINWAVKCVIAPAIERRWSDIAKSYTIGHGIGIDTGEALIVRGGARDNNDLISIGDAPNDAAHLSDYRLWPINITEAVYDALMDPQKLLPDGGNFWRSSDGRQALGGYAPLYHTNAWWKI